MIFHATCFCIRIVPLSAKAETHVVTVPTEEFEKSAEAWDFAKDALAEFLPRDAEPEDEFVMLDDENEERGYFFSCSVPGSDDHYHVILKYSVF